MKLCTYVLLISTLLLLIVQIKKQKTDLEMERKVISSYIKQIEDFIKVLEAIDSKAPYSKQSL